MLLSGLICCDSKVRVFLTYAIYIFLFHMLIKFSYDVLRKMHRGGWSYGALIGVPDLELGSLADQVTLVTDLGEQALGFLQSCIQVTGYVLGIGVSLC